MAARCVYRARYFNTVAGPFVGRLAYTNQSVRTVSERRRLNCSESPRTASFPGKRSRPRSKAARSPARNLPRNTRLRMRTGRKKSSRPATQRLSSGASPPPVTTQWTWGCSARFWPQVCSTASTPTSAPRCFGLAATSRRVSAAARISRPYTTRGLTSATGPRAPGSENTTWKYGLCAAAHSEYYAHTEAMASSSSRTHARRGLPTDELHIASGAVRLQRGQPLQEPLVLLPRRDRWHWRLDAGLVQGPSLHVEVGPSVDLGALEVGMAQEVSDHHQRIIRLQQVHRLAVTEGMRTDLRERHGRLRHASPFRVFLHQVADA